MLNFTAFSPKVLQTSYTAKIGTAEIAGGSPASFAMAKHVVILSIFFKSSPIYYYSCTGTILNPYVVLTAAHCVLGPKLKFDVERVTVRAGKYAGKGKVYFAKHIHVFKYFNEHLQNDIALISISGSFKKPYAAVRVPGSSSNLSKKATVFAAGFGMTSNKGPISKILQETKLRHRNYYTCRKIWPYKFYRHWSPKRIICVTAPKYPKTGINSVCKGDSGGPVYIKSGTNMIQVGITSFALPCGKKTSQSWAVNLKTYVPFIVQYVRNNYKFWKKVFDAAE